MSDVELASEALKWRQMTIGVQHLDLALISSVATELGLIFHPKQGIVI